MGGKRRENHDDWWRCEVGFAPVLDELFGVTNTKQGIRRLARQDRRTARIATSAERVGIDVAEIIVCGAVPRYTHILGGKLVSLLAASPEVTNPLTAGK